MTDPAEHVGPAERAPTGSERLPATPCSCAMLRRSARRVSQAYDRALKPAGLKLSQYSVLANVARAEGVTITQLAARMGLDRTTLTRNLRPMISTGWIRLKAARDRRAQAVHLTASGTAMLERARPLWREAERSFAKRLGPERLDALRALLDEAALSTE